MGSASGLNNWYEQLVVVLSKTVSCVSSGRPPNNKGDAGAVSVVEELNLVPCLSVLSTMVGVGPTT